MKNIYAVMLVGMFCVMTSGAHETRLGDLIAERDDINSAYEQLSPEQQAKIADFFEELEVLIEEFQIPARAITEKHADAVILLKQLLQVEELSITASLMAVPFDNKDDGYGDEDDFDDICTRNFFECEDE